eukprot:scaffold18337_cov67-Phaeocystis_antarctica.AAC.2
MHEHTVGFPQGNAHRLVPRAVVHGDVRPPASADCSLAQKQPRERPRPRAPALVRCCILHGLAFPGLYDLRGNLDGLPVLQEGHRCRDGYPDWRIHLRFRVQHRRILPREGDVFADVRCARKPEDHLDHRDCRAAVGQGDFPDECRRLRYLLPGSLRLLVPDLQEQAAGPKTGGDGAGEGDDEARELIERPCVALRSARDIIQCCRHFNLLVFARNCGVGRPGSAKRVLLCVHRKYKSKNSLTIAATPRTCRDRRCVARGGPALRTREKLCVPPSTTLYTPLVRRACHVKGSECSPTSAKAGDSLPMVAGYRRDGPRAEAVTYNLLAGEGSRSEAPVAPAPGRGSLEGGGHAPVLRRRRCPLSTARGDRPRYLP